MKNILIIILVVVIAFLILDGVSDKFNLAFEKITGSGNIITKNIEVSNFQNISLAGSGNIIIEQGEDESLIIEAEDNIMDKILVEIKGNTLDIRYKRTFWIFSWLKPTKDINYYIKLKDLSGIKISGSGTASAENIKTENMDINISGSGKINLNIETQTIKSIVSGSGDFNLSGQAINQEINISGSGKYFAQNLQTQNAIIKISGSGKIEVNAQKKLDINISGSGSVYYLGNPKINQKISGSGKIERLEVPEVEIIDSILNKEEAYNIAMENTECAKTGILTENYIYNDSTKTWWIDLERMPELEKDGCKPACVVLEKTKIAEVNWRCIGLITP